jgi:DNA-binding XRE family transcriptional regulator
MGMIKPLAETGETVTLSRADFERLVTTMEDAVDLAALRSQEEREARDGKESARADYLPVELVERMIAGESPVRIWREHRGLTGRDLAVAAGVSAAYLSEIEAKKKPGSVVALVALAKMLQVGVEDLAS